MAHEIKTARRWLVQGRVQGVGFRFFTQYVASKLGVSGYVRNLEDGSVEVYAAGPVDLLVKLARKLAEGPPGSDVWSVEETAADMQRRSGFVIEP